MKKLLIKTFMVSIVFFGTGFLLFYLVNARSGLTASNGDKLTASKWNSLNNIVPPIGTILAWHKSLSGTPSLPDGWVECNGQTLSDTNSSYNNQTIPNLNNASSGYSGGKFLRGGTVSGVYQDATYFEGIQNSYYRAYGLSYYQNADKIITGLAGDVHGATVDTTTTLNSYGNYYFRPINMSVIYIIRVR